MDDDFHSLSVSEQEALLHQYLDSMPVDDRNAFIEVMNWMAFERPKDAEPVTQEKIAEWVEAVKHRNLERKLGGKSAEVLPFRPPPK